MTTYEPHTDHILTMYQPHTDHIRTNCLYQPRTDHIRTDQFVHYYQDEVRTCLLKYSMYCMGPFLAWISCNTLNLGWTGSSGAMLTTALWKGKPHMPWEMASDKGPQCGGAGKFSTAGDQVTKAANLWGLRFLLRITIRSSLVAGHGPVPRSGYVACNHVRFSQTYLTRSG